MRKILYTNPATLALRVNDIVVCINPAHKRLEYGRHYIVSDVNNAIVTILVDGVEFITYSHFFEFANIGTAYSILNLLAEQNAK